jgi:predicted amidophosphoribosyltransferase
MFCDTCHWYTAGESVCPHCGAPQGPKKAKDMFNLPGDVSVLDGKFIDAPLTNAPMPAIETSAPPPPKPAPPAKGTKFCGRCGAKANADGRFCSACGAPLI